MNKKKCKYVLAGVTYILLLLTACQEKSEKIQRKGDKAASSTDDVIALACTVKDTAINGSGNSFFAYPSWNAVAVNLPAAAGIQFEGFSNSFIRPTSSGWFIGTVDNLDDSCATWLTIRSEISVKNAIGNLGSFPDTLTFKKENVVGIDGTFSGKNYGLGYYNYSPTTHQPDVTALVVIWKDAGTTWPTGISNPANIPSTDAFVISVHTLSVAGTGPYTDVVHYAYKKI